MTDPESDFGVPIPGRVLPAAEWTRTAFRGFPSTGRLDWPSIFGRAAPIVLELGCGNGRFSLGSALNRPGLDHFATDPLPLVIRYATRRANQRGLTNIRFAVRDAQSLLGSLVPPASVAEIHLYHPQPFHDPQDEHLRLVTPRFLADVHQALVPDGRFAIQTDSPEYWTYITSILPEFFAFAPHPDPWPDAPQGRTRREILARSRGLTIHRGIATRRDELDRKAALDLARRLPRPTFRTSGPSRALDAIEAQSSTRRGKRGRGG